MNSQGLLVPILCFVAGLTLRAQDVETTQLDSRPVESAPRVPSWAKIKEGTTADPASGLAREVTDAASGIEMVLIPAGTYERGASDDDAAAASNEKPRHRVTISKPFYLGRYEVTNAEFRKLAPRHSSGKAFDLTLDRDKQPVVSVTWADAAEFSRRLGMRLPTEAEWELAARGGKPTPFPWGSDEKAAGEHANVADATAGKTHPSWNAFESDDGHLVAADVGSFKPNGYGVHDMIGNVWEWCADAYLADAYEKVKDGVTDPRPATGATTGVLRGGSWRFGPSLCRVSVRFTDVHSYIHIGFRVARDP